MIDTNNTQCTNNMDTRNSKEENTQYNTIQTTMEIQVMKELRPTDKVKVILSMDKVKVILYRTVTLLKLYCVDAYKKNMCRKNT